MSDNADQRDVMRMADALAACDRECEALRARVAELEDGRDEALRLMLEARSQREALKGAVKRKQDRVRSLNVALDLMDRAAKVADRIIAGAEGERDRARDLAVRLEGELAQLTELVPSTLYGVLMERQADLAGNAIVEMRQACDQQRQRANKAEAALAGARRALEQIRQAITEHGGDGHMHTLWKSFNKLIDAALAAPPDVSGWLLSELAAGTKATTGETAAVVVGFHVGGKADCAHEWEPAEIHHDTTGFVDRSWLRCRLCGGMMKGVETVLKEVERDTG